MRGVASADERHLLRADASIAENGVGHDLEDHRCLMGCTVQRRSREEADVVLMAEEAHQWVDEVVDWWRTVASILWRYRHPRTLGDRHDRVRVALAAQAVRTSPGATSTSSATRRW